MAIHLLEIERNAEGDKLAIMSPKNKDGAAGSGYRIAGPKAWGGSHRLESIEIKTDDFVEYIKEYAPDVLKKLKEELK
jgi:hypothetical protein